MKTFSFLFVTLSGVAAFFVRDGNYTQSIAIVIAAVACAILDLADAIREKSK